MRIKFSPEYGVVGAGSVNAGLIGRLPRNAVALGPVAAVSYRVASRIANTLKAGWPVRSLDELDAVRLILFYSPPEHFAALSEALLRSRIQWPGKSLIFCDCEDRSASCFRALGASVARVRRSALPAHLFLHGSAPAIGFARRLARELKRKPVVVSEDSAALLDAALTMGDAGLTPLIDAVARALRQCGVRDTESVQLAAALFSKTAAEYAHSGRQSWQWHIEPPKASDLLAQIAALEEPFKGLMKQLILAGFSMADRHEPVARQIREALMATNTALVPDR